MSTQMLGRLWAGVRTARRILQREMARAVNVTPEQVSRWESGTHIPRGDNMMQVNQYLRIPTGLADEIVQYDSLPDDVIHQLALLVAAGQRPTVERVLRDLGY